MFLSFIEENLQFPKMVLAEEINRNLFKYMKFLTVKNYNVFFQVKLPRVLPIMKEFIQFAPNKRVGD